jgi:hypothetical protein
LFHIAMTDKCPSLPSSMSDQCRAFVTTCLCRDPLERPHATRLLELPYLQATTSLTYEVMKQAKAAAGGKTPLDVSTPMDNSFCDSSGLISTASGLSANSLSLMNMSASMHTNGSHKSSFGTSLNDTVGSGTAAASDNSNAAAAAAAGGMSLDDHARVQGQRETEVHQLELVRQQRLLKRQLRAATKAAAAGGAMSRDGEPLPSPRPSPSPRPALSRSEAPLSARSSKAFDHFFEDSVDAAPAAPKSASSVSSSDHPFAVTSSDGGSNDGGVIDSGPRNVLLGRGREAFQSHNSSSTNSRSTNSRSRSSNSRKEIDRSVSAELESTTLEPGSINRPGPHHSQTSVRWSNATVGARIGNGHDHTSAQTEVDRAMSIEREYRQTLLDDADDDADAPAPAPPRFARPASMPPMMVDQMQHIFSGLQLARE